MGPPSGRSGNSTGAIVGVKDPSTLQVPCDGGFLANDILMEKADGQVCGIVVYCSCWDALLRIRRV